MTLKHLKIFVMVCKCGSITEAGRKLYMAQPSVSLAIKELEAHYGTKLFDRISRQIYITDSGRRLLEYATHIVSLFEAAENNISDSGAKGEIRIGSSITIGTFLIQQYVKKFKEAYKNIQVRVYIDNSNAIENKVLSNDLDIALIEGNIHNESIIGEPFMEHELVFVCSKDHPFAGKTVESEELAHEDAVLREPGSAGRESFDSIMTLNGLVSEPVWESVSTQAIVNSVEAGLGVSVLPYLMVREKLASGELKRFFVKNNVIRRHLMIIYHRNKYISDTLSAFMDVCRECSAGSEKK